MILNPSALGTFVILYRNQYIVSRNTYSTIKPPGIYVLRSLHVGNVCAKADGTLLARCLCVILLPCEYAAMLSEEDMESLRRLVLVS